MSDVKLKSALSVLVLVACPGISPAVLAQAINFTVNGTITDVVCTPDVVGSHWSGSGSNGTVTLNNAKSNQLETAGDTAEAAQIDFIVTACARSENYMWVYFESDQVDAGRIVPTAGAAFAIDRVRFEIRDASTGNKINVSATGAGTGNVPGSGQGLPVQLTGSTGNRGATKSYIIQYYAQQGLTAAHSGSMSATATYTVKYF